MTPSAGRELSRFVKNEIDIHLHISQLTRFVKVPVPIWLWEMRGSRMRPLPSPWIGLLHQKRTHLEDGWTD